MNQESMATIAAIIGGTIPLGAVMFALIRWVDGRFRKDMAALRDEMRAGDGRLEGAIGELRDEMRAGDGRLEGAIGELRDEMRASDGASGIPDGVASRATIKGRILRLALRCAASHNLPP